MITASQDFVAVAVLITTVIGALSFAVGYLVGKQERTK